MIDASGSVSTETVAGFLRMQFEIAWALAWYHLETLTTEECLWRPARTCLHISQDGSGNWRADWPAREDYDIGPPSIGWTTWHMCYWWKKALAHTGQGAEPEQHDIPWPGSAEQLRAELVARKDEWLQVLNGPAETLEAVPANSWPLPGASVTATAAWLNIELAKNAAELGLMRFLHRVAA